MGERNVLFAVLLVVPLFALGVGYLIDSTYESKWRAAVQEQIPDIDRKQLDAMPLGRYCREVQESRDLAVCSWYPAVQMMQRGSFVAIVVGPLSRCCHIFYGPGFARKPNSFGSDF